MVVRLRPLALSPTPCSQDSASQLQGIPPGSLGALASQPAQPSLPPTCHNTSVLLQPVSPAVPPLVSVLLPDLLRPRGVVLLLGIGELKPHEDALLPEAGGLLHWPGLLPWHGPAGQLQDPLSGASGPGGHPMVGPAVLGQAVPAVGRGSPGWPEILALEGVGRLGEAGGPRIWLEGVCGASGQQAEDKDGGEREVGAAHDPRRRTSPARGSRNIQGQHLLFLESCFAECMKLSRDLLDQTNVLYTSP